MCFRVAPRANHLAFRRRIDGKWFHELGGVLCFRPDVCEESSNKDDTCSGQALASQFDVDGYALRSSFMGNNDCWLFQMENPGIEVSVEENMVDFYPLMLTKRLENEKNVHVCVCHVSREDFGFCYQIDEQCAPELAVESIMYKRPTGLKGDVCIGCTTEEASGSALKEMNGKTINGAAQTNCLKHNITLLRASSYDEPPDVG